MRRQARKDDACRAGEAGERDDSEYSSAHVANTFRVFGTVQSKPSIMHVSRDRPALSSRSDCAWHGNERAMAPLYRDGYPIDVEALCVCSHRRQITVYSYAVA